MDIVLPLRTLRRIICRDADHPLCGDGEVTSKLFCGFSIRALQVVTTSILIAASPLCISQKNTGMRVQFVGRAMEPNPRDYVQSGVHDVSAGHVFMIITIDTRSGPKEEAYGFYPREGGKSIIKGPGMLKSEFRCGAGDDCGSVHGNEGKRFSESRDSVVIPISESERRTLLRDVNIWDSRQYNIADHNCIDFVDQAVRDLGYPTPTRGHYILPTSYVAALKTTIERELDRRERDEAARQAEEAAARKRQADEETERERLANTVPVGWVACSCPQAHSPYGRWIQGTLYHPNNIVCPH
jgi:hypothetical protein